MPSGWNEKFCVSDDRVAHGLGVSVRECSSTGNDNVQFLWAYSKCRLQLISIVWLLNIETTLYSHDLSISTLLVF